MSDSHPKVLLTGATGFVGGRLLPALLEAGLSTRCLVRSAERFRKPGTGGPGFETVEGDLLDPGSLARALEGMDAAFYLVHSMGGRSISRYRDYIDRDIRAAENFVRAADAAGVKRIIYLGGLGETGDNLSDHLSSRQMVGEILQSGRVQTTALRAANIIGAGGAPFEMLRYLVERIPLMVCPRWIDTKCQPIAIQNVIEYLLGCLLQPAAAGLTLDIGGPDIITYRDLMLIYARARGLKRVIVTVPVLTPKLSSYWINLITPVPAGVVMPLVEGLKNEVICKDNRILDLVPIRLIPMEEAVCMALAEISEGPGRIPSMQSCLIRDV
ncbi:MAG: NAD(P)H-binding protein [Syntrophobacteraceae bacterium]|nr:NAD(P)H-binding protein [Syntrophobacteraceae bacterium]